MRRRKKAEAQAVGDPFAVLFTSLSVILLSFFILLCSMASTDGAKRREALGSLLGSFGILPGGSGFEKTGKLIGKGDAIGEGEESAVFAALSADLKKGKFAAELTREGGRWVLRVRDDAVFESSYHELSPRYFRLFDKVAEIARATRCRLRIVGHADGGPRAPANWLVSAERAASVARFLIEAGAVPSEQITAVGFGDRGVTPPGAIDASQRRVEVIFE